MSSSVGYPSGKRPGTAYAAAQAAKARRQMIMVGALCVVLAGVLAFEAPSFLKLFRGSSSSTSTTPVATTPAPTPGTEKALRAVRHASASDPFSTRVALAADSGVRQAAIPPGSRDPFAVPTGSSSPTPAATSTPLPEQIVIGAPGGNRTARHGWIVILASIPTSQGEPSATRFAATARQNGVDQVSVLNSSNRRPLRGGYWVVYTGPFKSLNDVSARASQVHSHGYATAYIRELIVYS
jgi:hypothetical protein